MSVHNSSLNETLNGEIPMSGPVVVDVVSTKEINRLKNNERERHRFATMSVDKKAELNARKRENYHRPRCDGEPSTFCLNTTDITLTGEPQSLSTVTTWNSLPGECGSSFVAYINTPLEKGIFYCRYPISPFFLYNNICITYVYKEGENDERSPEEVRREKDRKRYAQMPCLAKQEKKLKVMEGQRHVNIPSQAEVLYTPPNGTLHSEITQLDTGPRTRGSTNKTVGGE
ncbi:hypothetical protein SEVIR_3G334301v4 [Setaria viridis]